MSGDATAEELAAVVAAVALTASPAAGTTPDAGSAASAQAISIWSAPGYAHRSVRASFAPGPDSWRTSFWPR